MLLPVRARLDCVVQAIGVLTEIGLVQTDFLIELAVLLNLCLR